MPKLASTTSRHEQNLTGGHVSSVLLQSAASFLQRKLCLEMRLEVTLQQFLDLAGKTQSSQERSRAQPSVQRETLESFAF